MALLELRNVRLHFGGIVALDDVSMDVSEGQIVGLIGPNGAGKTTAFNVITRLYQPDYGAVDFDGRTLLKTSPQNVIRRGIARTFQNNELFPTMTVLDNVLIGAHSNSLFKSELKIRKQAMEILELVEIADFAPWPAVGLPFGTRKRVELARALVSRPRLLLLDEPAGGLNHEEIDHLGEFIKRLRDELKLTVLLVEHHMSLVMGVSDHVHVLNFGRLLAGGKPDDVQRNPAVVDAYLGGEVAEEDGTARAAEQAAERSEAPRDEL